jgi:hypothetical protein
MEATLKLPAETSPFDPVLVMSFVVLALYFAAVMALVHRLKSHHNEAWERLGRFSLFFNNSISGSWKFLRYFIFSNTYKELDDLRLNMLVLMVRILFAVFAILFIWNLLLIDR